jgi:OOP family OmpA-OmpF porin
MHRMGLMISMVAAATISMAADYEFSAVGGYVLKEGNLNIDNERLLGAELKYNGVESAVKPEFSVLYTPDVDYDPITETPLFGSPTTVVNSTSITRVALNGVYEYQKTKSLIPFAKAGIGYEVIENRYFENENGIFLDLGAGVKVPLTGNVALKAEALYMLKDPFDRADNNLAALVGLSFGFGGGAAAAAALPEECTTDSDNDGVCDDRDDCPDTPMEAQVDTRGCPLDSDGDGVIDMDDACPNTQAGFKVDDTGCPEMRELELTYEFDSAKIDEASAPKVHAFGRFLQDNPGYKIHVVGHTDTSGDELYNLRLSEARALSVRTMLVEQGIDASRITTEGRGELEPKADNETAEGRKANRRIEVQLSR